MALMSTTPVDLGLTIPQSENAGFDMGLLDALFPTQPPSMNVSTMYPDLINMHASIDAVNELSIRIDPGPSPNPISPSEPERPRPKTSAPRARPIRPAPRPIVPSAPISASASASVTDAKITSPSTRNTDSTPALDDSIDYGGRKRKRERNTEAARRYRQRRVDQVDELQAALAKMTEERDALRNELAGAKAEAAVLRDLIGGPKASDKS